MILLAFYLLGLSLWPCADELLFPSGTAATSYATLAAASIPQPGSSHPHQDQCTPFCSCTCCAVALTTIIFFSYSLTRSVDISPVRVVTFPYTPIHWADQASAIWQPPQLRV
ncbi:DUF6660 family protein [Spirosoma aerophilum]